MDTQKRQRSLQDLLAALTPKVFGYAGGGIVGGHPGHDMSRRYMRGSGLVHGTTGGRSDTIDMKVPSGAYVVPSDVVSGLGEGNSLAGGKRLAKMMPPADAPAFASGGIAGGPGLVDIRISPGEFLVHPQHVDALGGPEVLDQMVQNVRAVNARVAEGLPGPR